MSDEENGFFLAAAMQTGNHVLLAVVRSDNLNVGRGKSSVEQAFGHCFGCSGDVAHRISRVDFDEFFENVVRKLLGCVVELGRCESGCESESENGKRAVDH